MPQIINRLVVGQKVEHKVFNRKGTVVDDVHGICEENEVLVLFDKCQCVARVKIGKLTDFPVE